MGGGYPHVFFEVRASTKVAIPNARRIGILDANPLIPRIMILTHGAPDQLATLFAGLKALAVVDRDLHGRILRQALEANLRYLGVWAVWEPDALDGRDAEFVHESGLFSGSVRTP